MEPGPRHEEPCCGRWCQLCHRRLAKPDHDDSLALDAGVRTSRRRNAPRQRLMRVALFTREYPPHIYGGAGVHVEYLSRELAKKIDVDVHCWGDQHYDQGMLHVRGAQPWSEITDGAEGKFKAALETVSLNLTQIKALTGVNVVHTHTWYASLAG